MTTGAYGDAGVVPTVFGYLFCLFGVIFGFGCVMRMKRRTYERKIRLYLDAKNRNIFNPRGLHLTVGPRLMYV